MDGWISQQLDYSSHLGDVHQLDFRGFTARKVAIRSNQWVDDASPRNSDSEADVNLSLTTARSHSGQRCWAWRIFCAARPFFSGDELKRWQSLEESSRWRPGSSSWPWLITDLVTQLILEDSPRGSVDLSKQFLLGRGDCKATLREEATAGCRSPYVTLYLSGFRKRPVFVGFCRMVGTGRGTSLELRNTSALKGYTDGRL